MDTTLLQPFEVMGAIYAGLLMGIGYRIISLLGCVSCASGIVGRLVGAILDLLFYALATAIAAAAFYILADGRLKLYMLATMAGAAFFCAKTLGVFTGLLPFKKN